MKNAERQLVLKAVETMCEKMDNLKDRVEHQNQIFKERMQGITTRLDGLTEKADAMPLRLSEIIQKNVSLCRGIQEARIREVEKKHEEYEIKLKVIELRFGGKTTGYSPGSKGAKESYSV